MILETLAAVDIGSNATRLLIKTVEELGGGQVFRKRAYLRVPLRLGEDVFTTGRVSCAKAARLTEAVQGFAHIMRAYEVSGFRACATSAMRDAENGSGIAETIREQTGIEVEIISGSREADIIYAAGAMRGVLNNRASCLYVDVGGGSTEVVVYGGRRKEAGDSFRIGTVRMLSGAVDEAERRRFRFHLRGIYDRYAPASVIAAGGNINKIHKMLGKKDSCPILPDEFADLYRKIKPMSFEARMISFNLNDYRADVIEPALEIFISLIRYCPSIKEICVPQIGLADGLIHTMHTERLQGRKP
ncbi:MAG: hypothetical protein LBQ51_01260 [Desulfovibrio sp.]|jgi:exopolyphosphatase/guanosine-5'-triphosphate,3'-diphosphate pyrophosphatase|nr:hypothetical protein [Desulfovibrio sp.]